MCGVYGIAALDRRVRIHPDWLDLMGSVLVHRGPDDHGSYLDHDVAIGMRRLSIIDVAGGHQPLHTRDEALQLVCNGEIYNFRALRKELEAEGFRFSTGSDCEVILYLYEKHGLNFIERLDGMFAFALWDGRKRQLLLARDRVGIKPLYYLVAANRLIFASEAKAILRVPGVATSADPEGVADLVMLGYTLAPHSIFAGINKLEPGTMLICRDGSVQKRRFWSHERSETSVLEDRGDACEQFRATFERSVKDQMVSDVPLGSFLSGGVDSSAIVGVMAKNSSQPVKTFAIGFDAKNDPAGRFYNELPFARRVAKEFGTDHHEIIVRPDVIRLLPRLIWHMDEPIFDSALLTTFLVAEFARQEVTVILSGAGGDEVMGGYRRYLGPLYADTFNRVPRWIRRGVLLPLMQALPSGRDSSLKNIVRYSRRFISTSEMPLAELYASYVELLSCDGCTRLLLDGRGCRPSRMSSAFNDAHALDDINQLMVVDFATQLPDDILLLTDKMTMAASIECRVPLLSNAMVDFAHRVPGRQKIANFQLKSLMKEALADLLPADILRRKKWGFGAPIGSWMKRELRPLVTLLLGRENVKKRGFFDPGFIDLAVQRHYAGREDCTNQLLALVTFELWCRLFLDNATPEDLGEQLHDRLDFQVRHGAA